MLGLRVHLRDGESIVLTPPTICVCQTLASSQERLTLSPHSCTSFRGGSSSDYAIAIVRLSTSFNSMSDIDFIGKNVGAMKNSLRNGLKVFVVSRGLGP